LTVCVEQAVARMANSMRLKTCLLALNICFTLLLHQMH
jgi:hypothetical protein